MTPYWLTYLFSLIAFLGISIGYIEITGSFPMVEKIVFTVLFMVLLTMVALDRLMKLRVKLWRFVFLIGFSLFYWAFQVDTWMGLIYHNDPFYLGHSWPDSLIRMPGELYFMLKCIALGVFGGLLYYIDRYTPTR